MLSDMTGYGDPDFVLSVPPAAVPQRLRLLHRPHLPGDQPGRGPRQGQRPWHFQDVTLDCAGALTGWQPVGDYEWTRIDLMPPRLRGPGNCSTGPHEISSSAPFGLWVWGWGSPETTR